MKKKNLLTLGALCLSLGLVVSSCNQAGTEGPTGPTGPTGPQGEPGVPGSDGKTYKDVIVVNDNDIIGGTVTQDVYFVTQGEHDSVTFTFVPKNPTDNIVVNFEINGKVVENLDPSATSYTIEDADDYEGSIQVTGIEFTTVDKYGVSLLEDFVKSLCESDKSLDLTKTEGNTVTHFLGEGEDSKYVKNDYSEDATSAIQAAYDDALEDLKTAISDAKKEHKDDVSAQIEAITTAEQTAETAITEAYQQAIDDAKVQAESDLDELAEAITDENYTDENRAADKASIQANIDSATTIEGLGNVIDGPSPLQVTEGASGNLFIGAKQKAFEQRFIAYMDLLRECHFNKNILEKVVEKTDLTLRDGAKEFFRKMYENNIPVIIISSSIKNVIEEYLKQNHAYYDNIYIYANYLDMNGKQENDITNVTPYNKDKIEFSRELKENIKGKKYVVLLGDIPDDVNMVSKEKLDHTITIGFLEENIESNLEKYNKTFDIVLTNNASFKEVLKLIDFN